MSQIFSACRVGLIFLVAAFEAVVLKCSVRIICNWEET